MNNTSNTSLCRVVKIFERISGAANFSLWARYAATDPDLSPPKEYPVPSLGRPHQWIIHAEIRAEEAAVVCDGVLTKEKSRRQTGRVQNNKCA